MSSNAVKIDNIFRPFSVIREHQKSYPVDVEALAKDFNIPIVYKDWPDDWSGAIGKDDNGFFIIVNKNHPEVRQRFTIAHEIAHYVLHCDQIGDGIKDDWKYRSRVSDADERAANKLAAEILMPADLLGQAAADVIGASGVASGERMSEQHLAEIAKKLKVSTTALAIRLGVPV
jgi:Zn-dependent peptidase ImmA (M78 family)